MEKHAVNVNVDMFGIGNILDNPKKTTGTPICHDLKYIQISRGETTPLEMLSLHGVVTEKKLSACAAGQIWWNMIIYFQSILSVRRDLV